MGQGPILRKPGPSGGKLPEEIPGQFDGRPIAGGVDTGLQGLLDFASGVLGIDRGSSPGRPGSMANGAGQLGSSAVAMLPIAKLLKLMRMGRIASEGEAGVKAATNLGDQALRNHMVSPGFENEFMLHEKPVFNVHEGLPEEELAKMKELTALPKKRTPNGV